MPDPQERASLTEAQRAAVEARGETLVSAAAGSGKTRVLTERFVNLVLSGEARVPEILALTFTEKAARHMKEKIVERFQELGRESERREVEAAYIGTIHSFGARLLRENALEAGVDPNFVGLDEPAAFTLQHQAFEQVCRRTDRPEIAALLVDYDFDKLRDLTVSAYGRLRSLGRRPEEAITPDAPDIGGLIAAAREAVEAAVNLPRSTASLGRILGEVAACASVLAKLKVADGFDWAVYDEVVALRKSITLGVPTAAKETMRAAAEAVDRLTIGMLAAPERATALAFRDLLSEFHGVYTQLKDENGYLDFADMLVRAAALLGAVENSTPTALRYREQFQHVLMDEFQDTNRLQMAVIRPVCRPDRFFAVGDAKQSIFRFLYADVNVFLSRQKEIEGRGGQCLPLPDNFRSHPDLLGFVNALFDDIWAEDGFTFDHLTPKLDFGPREEPRVELLLVPAGGDMTASREAEAEAIALRIRELVGLDGHPPLLLTEKDKEGPVTFGDIMILFRATPDIQLYERALHEHDIDYYVVSGRGFYATPEVQDIANLLRAVNNPFDDTALAAALRSPLAGVSDDALFWLSTMSAEPAAGRVARGLTDFEAIPQLKEIDRDRLASFRDLFEHLRSRAASGRITDLVDEAFRATEYDLKALAQRNGRRRYANLGKLREVAYTFQTSGSFSLTDFLDYLESLRVLADRETEAPTEAEESDVVRLMTIHKAKGLEAPVVIVADLFRRRPTDEETFLVSDTGRIAGKVYRPAEDQLVKPPAYQELADLAAAETRREYKRLFYVACTRAKEQLILSSGVASKEPGAGQLGTWLDWVRRFTGIAAPPTAGQCSAARLRRVAVRWMQPAESPGTRGRRRPTLVQQHRELLLKGFPLPPDGLGKKRTVELAAATARALVERVRAPLPTGRPSPPVLSVTAAARFLTCPRMYYWRDVEGLPEAAETAALQEADEEVDAAGEEQTPLERGTIFHSALCALRFDSPDPDYAALVSGVPPIYAEDLRRGLARFAESEIFRELAASPDLRREVPFLMCLAGDTSASGGLRGQIDALYRRADAAARGGAGWTVLDYKTGRAGDRSTYDLQVALYAVAVRKLLGEAPERVILHFLDAGETYSRATSAKEMSETESRLREAFEQIAAGDFPLNAGPTCAACHFRRWCEAGGAVPRA